VTLKVYDLSGREVATLIDEIKPAGEHHAVFQAEHLPSGVYIYRLQAGSFVNWKRMLLLR